MKRPAVLAFVVLALLTAAAANPAQSFSIRMEALGRDLVGLVDDRASDLIAFPHRNCTFETWHAGLSVLSHRQYQLFGTNPGPLSFAGFTEPYLGDQSDGRPAFLSVSFPGLGTSWGIEVGYTDGAKYGPIAGAQLPGYAWYYSEGVRAITGAATSLGSCELDALLEATYAWGPCYYREGDSTIYTDLHVTQVEVLPTLRLTVPVAGVNLRAMASYARNEHRYPESPPDIGHSASLVAGVGYRPVDRLLLASGIRTRWAIGRRLPTMTHWRVPVGLEYRLGPTTLRLGVVLKQQYFTKFTDFAFDRNLTAGFALHPLRNVRLDFVVGTQDAINIESWEFGTTLTL
jgi:hypothetical protein